MRRTWQSLFVLGVIMVAPASVFGQVEDMQAIAQALGVGCEYCHVRRGAESLPSATASGKPKREIAREMIAMTRDLNAQIQAAAGKSPADATRVTCITCHRGVPIPRQLSEIVTQTMLEKGVAAAVVQYRDLRAKYYGRQSYDFSEDELFKAAQRFIERKPDDAIALLQLNLEFNPQSARTYVNIGYAYTRKYDKASAIASYEKALAIDPDNGIARGYLAQLKDR